MSSSRSGGDEPPPPDPEKVVGIDLGLINFATFTDAPPIPAPKFYIRALRKVRLAHRTLDRRQPGSKRREKARRRLARVYARISDQRRDFLHKLTTDLVRTHDGICIEDLILRGLVKIKRLAKGFQDASCGEFRRQVEYKCRWHGKHLAVVDRFFPSSRLCRDCGRVNAELAMRERAWTCECGVRHVRDENAARNIRDEGLRIFAAGQAENRNARGRPVRPAKAGKAG